jgi:glycosyltransferase involved in cell wall biosynthesis
MPRSLWGKNPSTVDLSRPASPVYVSLLTKASSAAAAITTSSTALQKKFGGTLIPHGVNTKIFDPNKVNREAFRQQFKFDGLTILFAGTPREHKGILPLLEAVRQVPGAHVVATCREKDLNEPKWSNYPLLRIPFVPYNTLPQLLAAADIIVIPQIDTEVAHFQMPMKVFDSMAMGKPIVASSVSDLPLVLEGCGLLVPPGDVDKLAEAISELVNNPGEACALGERARARCIEKYSIEKIGEKLFEVVRKVMP